jgi:hypothetical protein
VTAAASSTLDPITSDDVDLRAIPDSATLRDALAALLESDSARIRVGDAGVLTMEGVRQALRSAQGS